MGHELGGTESQGIITMGQTAVARLMESGIQPAGSVALLWEGLNKKQKLNHLLRSHLIMIFQHLRNSAYCPGQQKTHRCDV